LSRKLDVMGIHEAEIGQHRFPRSEEILKALATFRGLTAGVQYAKAFQLLKWREK
jgi:N-acetylglucosamine malate deacetylase 1